MSKSSDAAELEVTLSRGQEVWSPEWHGTRLYVGAAPYGRQFIVPADAFEEVCAWFDAQEARGWNDF